MRIDLCANDDYATIASLQTVLSVVGAVAEHAEPEQPELGMGFHRFTTSTQQLTIYIDAWGVDLEGPDDLVNRVLILLTQAR